MVEVVVAGRAGGAVVGGTVVGGGPAVVAGGAAVVGGDAAGGGEVTGASETGVVGGAVSAVVLVDFWTGATPAATLAPWPWPWLRVTTTKTRRITSAPARARTVLRCRIVTGRQGTDPRRPGGRAYVGRA